MKVSLVSAATSFLVLALSAQPPAVRAGGEAGNSPPEDLTRCEMTFDLRGWSAFYKTSKGEGVIRCDNGQEARVRIKAKGGGITFGKSEVIGGTGRFTGARSLEELFGAYAQSEAHAGAGKSGSAQALTKGEVSLTLVGRGRGVDVGFAFGKLTIEPAE